MSQEIPEFDLDRLAKEIDEVFQVKSENNLLEFDKKASKSADEWRLELENLLEKHKTAAAYAARNMRQQIMKEITKGKATIILPDATEITIENLDHPQTPYVIKSFNLHNKAMLVGPAGTGKTYMVAEIAKRMKLEFYKYSCSRDSSVHDLLGYKQPKSETYLETTFLKAYENGGVFLVDEYDAMSGDMALFFNGVADSSTFLSVPHRDEKPQAIKHKDFYLVMCGNTWGKGSTDYSGRDFQDMALMDRFRFSRHHVGYHIELEKSLMGDNYVFTTKLRKELEKVGSYLSTRNIEDIAKLLLANTSKNDIVDMIIQDLSEPDAKIVRKAMLTVPSHRGESKYNKRKNTIVGTMVMDGMNQIQMQQFMQASNNSQEPIWESIER